MIIGISGKARHGKDTAAFLLQEHFAFRRLAFADVLKAACAEIFGFDHAQLYGERKEELDPHWCNTPRYYLQQVGVALRQVSADIWIHAGMRKITTSPLADWVVTDVRFPNEADAIRRAGGYVIRINRPDAPPLPAEAAAHTSETALDDYPHFAARVENAGNMADLEGKMVQLYLYLLDGMGANEDRERREGPTCYSL